MIFHATPSGGFMFSTRTLYPLLTLLGLAAGGAGAAPVNINTADAATLARDLKGIGDSKATAIVDYRLKHGAFHSVDDLAMVKGVGQKLVERNRADLRVNGAAATANSVTAAKPAAKPATTVVTRR
jgi:competence protein ComEA